MAIYPRAASPVHQLEGRTLQWLAGPEHGTGSTSLLENVIEPGSVIPAHHHEVEELLLCLEGQGLVVVDGQAEPFMTGDSAVIEAGTVHSVHNTGTTPFRMLAFFPTAQPLAFWQGGAASPLT